jgi:hypothetical protein
MLSADPNNTVVALVRDVDRVTEEVKKAFPDRKNLHLVHGDLISLDILKVKHTQTSSIIKGIHLLINDFHR